MNMLNIDVTKSFTNAGDALSYGLSKSLFGILVVFGALILIWAILSLFKVFFYTIPNAKKNGKTEKAPKAAKVSKSVSNNNIAAASSATPDMSGAIAISVQDHSVVAAIVSAISAYRSSNGETGAFRVVSFKKRK